MNLRVSSQYGVMAKLIRAIGVLVMLGLSIDSLMACTLVMGYRETAKAPFINQSPDNSGFYKELYSKAANRIGCSLEIVRKPKKRIYNDLKAGSVDFYPRMSFLIKRTSFIYYIDTGFESYNAGLSRGQFQEVTSLAHLKGKRVIRPLGTSNPFKPEWGVKLFEVPKLDIDRAIKMLERKHADFFIYDLLTLKYFLSSNNISGLKLHLSCCKRNILKHLGFSRKSRYFSEKANLMYDKSKETSVDNSPTDLVKGSIADLFAQALQNMKATGETQKLLNRFTGAID